MAELMSTMPECTLDNGFQIVFEAIDPTTGANVTGVTISNAAVYADTPGDEGFTVDVAASAPLFVPIPNDQLNE